MWIKLGPPTITVLGKNPPPEVLWPHDDEPQLTVTLGAPTELGAKVQLNGQELSNRVKEVHWTTGVELGTATELSLTVLLVDRERGITADMLRDLAPPGVRIVEDEAVERL